MSSKQPLFFTIAISAMMAALVTVATYIIQIPIPQTSGYLNIGDAMVFTAALTFGPSVGLFAGGVGSAISDMMGGYAYFAPVTLVVKGLEGLLVGLVGYRKNLRGNILAVGIGSAVMISGYFLAETFLMGYGVGAALVEVPLNLFQVTFGGIVGIPLSAIIRRYVLNLQR